MKIKDLIKRLEEFNPEEDVVIMKESLEGYEAVEIDDVDWVSISEEEGFVALFLEEKMNIEINLN